MEGVLLAWQKVKRYIGRSFSTNLDTREIIRILDKVVDKQSLPHCDVVGSHYDSQTDAIADIKDHIERVKKSDCSRRQDFKLLFAPTGSLQEISIYNGWGDEFLDLANQFDKAIVGGI
ncbi:MAG: hypothetical protein JXA42_15855 [Anaerolineales bacterium]|nr:hypothetical protein [Anaerolineales bacterium]